jgi:hypothetical protein
MEDGITAVRKDSPEQVSSVKSRGVGMNIRACLHLRGKEDKGP